MVQWNNGNKNPWYALWDTTNPTVSMHDWGESDHTYVGWDGADGIKLAADHILPPVTAASPAGIFYSSTDPYLAAVVMSFTLGNGATVQFMDYVTFSPGYLLHSLEVYLYFFDRPTAPLSIGTQGNAFASSYAAAIDTHGTGDTADYTSLFGPSVTAAWTPSATPLAGVVVDNTHFSANVTNGISMKFGVEMTLAERGTHFSHPWPTSRELHVLTLVAPSSATCQDWCNVHTCGMSQCSSCAVCTSLAADEHCSFWCNTWTCWSELCEGCTVCA